MISRSAIVPLVMGLGMPAGAGAIVVDEIPADSGAIVMAVAGALLLGFAVWLTRRERHRRG